MISAKEVWEISSKIYERKMEKLSKKQVIKINKVINKKCKKGLFCCTLSYAICKETKNFFENLGYSIEEYEGVYGIKSTGISWNVYN